MKLFKIKNVKKMMSELLINNGFDEFNLCSFRLLTMVEYNIDGRYNTKWNEYMDTYIRWKDVKQTIYSLIKGSKTPSKLKAVMMASDDVISSEELCELKGEDKLILNIKFENDELSVTTGISMASFSLDNKNGKLWDNKVERLLDELGLEYEELE